ncbi:MAG: hypothetical protein SOZ71_05130 [Clostridium sp.]|nr:hypothetical protein [Clostridium sp.]
MLKKVITIIMLGLIGVSCVSCGKEKVSLRDTVTNLQKAGASSIKNSGISIELVDSKGKLKFSKNGDLLYDINGDLVGDAYIGISEPNVYKNIKEDRYLISDKEGNSICITLVNEGEEPKCPSDKLAVKIN